MPEIQIGHTPFIDEVTRRASASCAVATSPLSLDEVEAIAKNFNQTVIGSGRERFVLPKKSDPDFVVAINFKEKDPIVAKKEFFLHRGLTLLWPYNFPGIIASAGSENGTISGSLRQKVKKNEAVQIPYSSERKTYKQVFQGFPIAHAFEAVERDCRQWDLPFAFDPDYRNFILGRDGGLYYVDTALVIDDIIPINTVEQYLQAKNYPAEDASIILKSFSRYNELAQYYCKDY